MCKSSDAGVSSGTVVFYESACEEPVAAPDRPGIPVLQAVGQALHLRVSASERPTATRQLVSRGSLTPLLQKLDFRVIQHPAEKHVEDGAIQA